MIILTPTAAVKVTRSINNTKKVDQKKRKETIKYLGYKVAASKLKRRIWLLFLMNTVKNLYFLTITFPVGTSDECAHWLLNTFLTNMRNQGYFNNYIWVSERQKNGTIHFHFYITKYTPAQKIQKGISSSLTTAYRKGLSTYPPQKAKKYQGFYFSKNRKGRVQNLKKIKKNKRKLVINYCAKYISKDTEQTDLMPICHRRSGTSKSIMRMKLSTVEVLEGERQVYKYIIAPAKRFGVHYIEKGYEISLMQDIPPDEFTVFWEYIDENSYWYAGIDPFTRQKIK